MEKIIILIGFEALTCCILILFGVQWGKKLDSHLKDNYPKFYKDNLEAPLLAGGSDVFLKHYHAFKTIHSKTMPDSLSSFYQKKIHFYSKVVLASLLLLFGTLIFIPLYGHFYL